MTENDGLALDSSIFILQQVTSRSSNVLEDITLRVTVISCIMYCFAAKRHVLWKSRSRVTRPNIFAGIMEFPIGA